MGGIKHETRTVREIDESWSPTVDRSLSLTLHTYPPTVPHPCKGPMCSCVRYRVTIWGGDDTGMEIDFPEGCEEEARHLYESVPDGSTKDQLLRIGFRYA